MQGFSIRGSGVLVGWYETNPLGGQGGFQPDSSQIGMTTNAPNKNEGHRK